MKAKPSRKNGPPRFRPDSYEASLTATERMSLYGMLFDDQMTLFQIQGKAMSWNSGRGKDNQPPGLATLSKIRNRLRLESMILDLEGINQIFEAARRMLAPLAKDASQERMLDEIMVAISAEVIDRTMRRIDPCARTSAARLLLKRADQRRVDRRLNMLETEFKRDTPADKSEAKLTPDEKQERIRQILGTE